MHNKYSINSLDGIVKDFSTQHLAAWWTDIRESGYFTAVYDKGEKFWFDTPGIERHIRDVIAWAKRYHGWRKAARLKKAAWDAYCWDIQNKNYREKVSQMDYHKSYDGKVSQVYHRKNFGGWCKGARFKKAARNA